MNLFSLTASSQLPAMASCTASSAYWDRGFRCSVDSVFTRAPRRSWTHLGRTPMNRGCPREDEYRYCQNAARPNLDNLHVLRPPAAALVAALSLTMGGSCLFGPQGPVIKIGVDLPLSGAEAGAAVPAINGIRYYVQQHPTLDGFTVVLSESDDSSGGLPDPHRGADNVRAFL